MIDEKWLSVSTDLIDLAAAIETRVGDAENAGQVLQRLGSDYAVDHQGPDVTLASESLTELASFCTGLADDYQIMADAIKARSTPIAEMENKARTLLAGIADVSQAQAISGSRNTPGGPDTAPDDTTLMATMTDELDLLQTDLVLMLQGLGAELAAVSIAPEPVVDSPALAKAGDRFGLDVGTYYLQFGAAETLGLDITGRYQIRELESAGRMDEMVALLSIGLDAELATQMALDGNERFLASLVAEVDRSDRTVHKLLQSVVDAMAKGQSPTTAGLPTGLFPPRYLNSGFIDIVGEGPAARPSSALRLNPRLPPLPVNEAVMSLYEVSGHAPSAGQRLADQLRGDAWQTWAIDPRPYTALGDFAGVVATDRHLAASFFNALGPDDIARLSRLYSGPSTMEVAAASQLRPEYSRQAQADAAMQELANGLGLAARFDLLAATPADLAKAHTYSARYDNENYAGLITLSETMPDSYIHAATAAALDGRSWAGHTPQGSIFGGRAANTVGYDLALNLAERDPALLADVLLATEHPGDALRAGYDEQWSDTLVSLTYPSVTGSEQLSIDTATWIVATAGHSDERFHQTQAAAVAHVLATRPTMLVQGPNARIYLEAAGVEPNDSYLTLGQATTDQALAHIYESNGGEKLDTYHDSILRVMATAAVSEGLIPPDSAAGVAWGEVDAAIGFARFAHGLGEAQSLDQRNKNVRSLADSAIGAVAGTTLASTGAKTIVIDAFAIDQTVGEALGRAPFLPTDNELSYYRGAFSDELDRGTAQNFQVMTVLDDAGVLMFNAGGTGGELALRPLLDGQLEGMREPKKDFTAALSTLFVVGDDGGAVLQPGGEGLSTSSTSTLDARYINGHDWTAWLAGYNNTRDASLGARHDRLAND